ncbi:hypothetical protein [Bythopirellula goksoeyrii]|uniref:Uncharacterized protein n=1 Tax=Bythopirellula goksoeyrii TaxID=1400387 RepID=A0A5B9QLP9_9BACT|nr:hypothetical protein [Bythopirellula goksoeyrii]QEG35071.1 hypothetical protein Pr1d_23620 [Bythopirellula goksoeyrii]
MSTIDQINDFAAFALTITKREGDDISLDVIYDRWWQERHGGEDLLAIQEAHAEYESGHRGELARTELANFRAERSAGKKA